MERFHQIVVGAEAEPAHPFCGRSGPAQHEHHRALAGGADHLAERVARDPRQAAVQHDHVVVVHADLAGGFSAVIGHVGSYALVREAFGHQVGQGPAVVHYQDPHPWPLANPSRGVRPRPPARGTSGDWGTSAARRVIRLTHCRGARRG